MRIENLVPELLFDFTNTCGTWYFLEASPHMRPPVILN